MPVISDAAVVVPAAVEEIQAVMAEGVEVIKRLFSRIALYSIAALIGYTIYAKANVPPETDAEYCKRKGMVKIHNRFYKYDVYQHNEMKPFVDMLTKGCNGNPYCEVDRAYQYVLKIPYKESSTNRNPSDVINQNGGDCDEKSFLLATLLLQKQYPCLLITTKDHGFIGIHIANEKEITAPASYVSVEGKKYYLAETTTPVGYIGQDNGVKEQEIEGVFDMMAKKEIPIEQVDFFIVPLSHMGREKKGADSRRDVSLK
ncbi:MAG: hypothetical protein M0P91_05865 [Sulfuricurvum sp.]|uniref:hypothetical protein n=1 Tax=Sulfuricurvum sp. TaxID=2025608 RepID=UPI0025D0EEBA|nr:hypothetical protein [Sulfuricurvum sp.]MCK9372705.1 hypothetical protein [Sulfuricurvum sp.]